MVFFHQRLDVIGCFRLVVGLDGGWLLFMSESEFWDHNQNFGTLNEEVKPNPRDQVEINFFKVVGTSKPSTQTTNNTYLTRSLF